MAESRLDELKAAIQELKGLHELAKLKKVQDILSLDIRKLETELINIQESIKPTKVVTDSLGESSRPIEQQRRYEVKLNGYGWDQSDKFVKVFVTLKDVQNLPKENVFCNLTEKSMQLNVKDLENKDYILIINNLLDTIDTVQSYWKQKTDMVVVFLAKSRPNVKWSHMTEIEKRFEEKKANRFKTDDMSKKDPQESIMSLMKNMYETGDDDMKRMIAKAWTEGQEKKNTVPDL